MIAICRNDNKTKVLIERIKIRLHFHRWETTHVNRWYYPTKQKCKCGMTRKIEKDNDFNTARCMPYDKVRWLLSDGTTQKWSVLD